MRPLVFPRSLAVIGPSMRGGARVANALSGCAPTIGIHPSRRDVHGLRCIPDWSSLSEDAPETALVLVGHQRIEAAVGDALAAGVRAFVVPGLGTEAGRDGQLVASAVASAVDGAGGVLLGPNCMGVAVPGATSTWLSRLPDSFLPGGVAAVVQSGSVGDALVSLGPRIGFRAVVSSGAEALVDVAELVDFFCEDERTSAIALFMETVRRPDAFDGALERCRARGKPVVCLKVGRSEVAARAALAHTGAIVGSQRAFSALLRRHGVIEVDDLPELVEVLEVLGRGRRPRGARAASVSESGGEAALLADQARANGVRMDPLPEAVERALRQEFPLLEHANNPLDAWALDTPERIYPRALELMAESDAYDIVLAQVDLSRFRSAENQEWSQIVVRALGSTIAAHAGLFGAVVTVHATDPPDWAYELARQQDVALLRGSRNAMLALGQVALYTPRRREAVDWGPPIAIDDLIVDRRIQPEFESAAILERYGVAFAERRRAASPEEAAAAARELGPPVVVKCDGAAHKAAVGGVRLGIATPEQASRATSEIGAPVLVAAQIPHGQELICGMQRDPQFGPVIVFGHGGSGVEHLSTLSALVGPLDDIDVARLIADVGISDHGGAFAQAIRGVDRLAAEHPEVLEVDINPLIVTSDGAIAADALIVIDGPE